MNIHFIRAAILDATGINLTLEQVREYLVSEGMISVSKAKSVIFRGYGDFYEPSDDPKEEYTPDLVELLED